MASSSSCRKKKSVASITEPSEIIDEYDYFQNYEEISHLIKHDLDPTQTQIQQVITALQQQMPETSMLSILEVLAKRLNQQQHSSSQENTIKSEYSINIDQKENSCEQLNLGLKLKKRQKIFRRTKYDLFDVKYSYDPTPVPEYKKIDRVPQPSPVSHVESTFNFSDKNVPLFRDDAPFDYKESDYVQSTWDPIRKNRQDSQEETKKHLQKVLAARALVYRGYGYPQLKEEMLHSNIPIHISPQRYKVVSCSTILDVFKNIEGYVDQKFSEKYIPLNSMEFKTIHSSIFNYRVNFRKQEAETFQKMVKITYSLENPCPQVSSFEVMELYRQMMINRQIKTSTKDYRIGNYRKNSSFRIRDERVSEVLTPNDRKPAAQFWNIQRQRMMIDIYCKKKVLAEVRYQFRSIYPALKKALWFDYNFIKNRIDKIYREVLRKIQIIIPRQQIIIQNKVTINDRAIKEIVKSPHSLELKLLLAQIYRDDSFNFSNITEVMRLMSIFFQKQVSTYAKRFN